MLDKILESLDSEIFTDDMKENMKKAFDQKVKNQVAELSEEFQKKQENAEASLDEKVVKITKEYDKKIEEISEEFETEQSEKLEESKKAVIGNLNKYLERIVEEIVEENKPADLDRAVVEEAGEINKVFRNLMNEYKFKFENVSEIVVENAELEDLRGDLNKAVETISDLKEEIESGKKERKDIVKSNLVDIVADKFDSDIQKFNFIKIAENFKYDNEQSYNEQLNSLFESMKDKKIEGEATEEDFEEESTEKKVEDSLIESINEGVVEDDFMSDILDRI